MRADIILAEVARKLEKDLSLAYQEIEHSAALEVYDPKLQD